MNTSFRLQTALVVAMASTWVGCSAPVEPAVCSEGRWDHDDNPATDCLGWTVCSRGMYVAQEGSDTSDRVCVLCPDATYAPYENSERCEPWSPPCQAGEYIRGYPTAITDWACEACADGLWDHDRDPATRCEPRDHCEPGTYASAAGSALSNRTCAPCAEGTYAPGWNAATCEPWTKAPCTAGQFTLATPSATSDWVCRSCGHGSWDHDLDPSTDCVPWTVCGPGQFVRAAGTGVSDQSCSACEDGTYSSSRNAARCEPWSECVPGEFQAREGSATSNRDCRPCDAGTWDHDGDTLTECEPWTQCAPGSYVSEAGTATGDQICLACPAGFLATQPNQPACYAPVSAVDGSTHTCALLVDGTLKCWGYVEHPLGYDTSGPLRLGSALPAIDLGTGRSAKAVAVAVGKYHTCALLDDGPVKCWGDNSFGQLGLGDRVSRGWTAAEMGDALPAVDLGTGRTAKAIAAGRFHNCVLLDDDTVKCWGEGYSGQTGKVFAPARGDEPGEMGDAMPALNFGAVRTATAITAGDTHTCALLTNGQVKCWGSGAHGQLGHPSPNGEPGDGVPGVDLGSGRTAIAIAAGGAHTCALLDNAQVKCWGATALGLGDRDYRGDQPGEMGDALPPVDLGTGRTARAISAGVSHTCALLDDGSVKCWGGNRNGQLGLGDERNRGDEPGEMGDALPAVSLGTGRLATSVGAFFHTTCAVLDDGMLKCWGLSQGSYFGGGKWHDLGDAPGEMGDALPDFPVHSSP